MRKVVYFITSNNDTREIMSAATTWGQLKSELGGVADKMRFVIRETRVTLESNDAVLPTTDITIFGFPLQNKSGLSQVPVSEVVKSLNELRAQFNEALDGIMEEVVADYGDSNQSNSYPSNNPLAQAAKEMEDEFDN